MKKRMQILFKYLVTQAINFLFFIGWLSLGSLFQYFLDWSLEGTLMPKVMYVIRLVFNITTMIPVVCFLVKDSITMIVQIIKNKDK